MSQKKRKLESVGIVVEYNPFHNGHLYHLNQTKHLNPNKVVIAIMSGYFTQRGEPTIVNKWIRANEAIKHGVDIVIELPTYYAIQSADYFAYSAISILNMMNINSICFGSETNDLNILYDSLKQQESKSLDKHLDNGASFPASFDMFNKSNDILGTAYIKAIQNANSNIQIQLIKRTNNYHDLDISQISSATSIRNALKHGNNIDITTPMSNILFNSKLVFLDQIFDLLKYSLCTRTSEELKAVHLVSEGIENLFKKQILKANTIYEFIDLCISKRYTRARIQRTIISIVLNQQTIKEDAINYVRILGLSSLGQQYLNQERKNIDVPILRNYKSDISKFLDFDLVATQIYALISKENHLISKEFNFLLEH